MLPSLALANQSPKDPDIYNLFENHIFGLAYPNRKKKKKNTQSLIWETDILVLFYTRKAKTLVEVLYPIPTYTQLD